VVCRAAIAALAAYCAVERDDNAANVALASAQYAQKWAIAPYESGPFRIFFFSAEPDQEE
jgi:hypothetical protein